MTTEEKLFVQIFERKKWIIEQVKQQTDFYIQNLGSKLLVDGITPPPSLWNPSYDSHSADPKELKKEDLISKLLLPRNTAPYGSGHCYVYDKPVVTRENAELSGRYCLETHASIKKINASISMLESRDNDVGCALDGVLENNFSVNSQGDETNARISNKYSSPDQSLARIQRSRSRQKALELRTSAKAAKGCLNHDNTTDIYFSGNSLSRIDFQKANHDKGSSKSAIHYDVSGKNTGSREVNERNFGEGFGSSKYNDGITESRSPYKQAGCVTESHNDGSSKVTKEKGGALLQPAHDSSENFCGRITRSKSSSLQSHSIDRPSLAGTSTYAAKEGSVTLAQSVHKPLEQVVHSDMVLKAILPPGELIGRKTRSQFTSSTEDTSLPVKSSGNAARRITRSMSGATKESPLVKPLSKNEGNFLPNALGCQLIPLCPIVNVNQHENAEMETQLVDVRTEAEPLYLGSNLDGSPPRKDSEGLVLNPSSNCHMVVRPKHLDFDDLEECILNKKSSPPSRKEHIKRLSGDKCSALLDTLASPNEVTPGSHNEGLLEEQSQMLSNALTKPEVAQNDVNVEKCSGDKVGTFRSKLNKNPVGNTGDCNSEAALHNQVCFLEDPPPLDVLNNSDKEVHLENCEVIKGYAPSPKLQIEEEEFGSKEKNSSLGSKEKSSSATTPSKSIPKLAEPSVISSLAKQRTNDFQNCLDKEEGIPEPTGFDAAKELHVQGMQNILLVENTDIYPERMLVESTTDVGEGHVSGDCPIGLQCTDNNCGSFSGQTEIQFIKSFLLPEMEMNPTKVESWPQSKRRKVENQLFSGSTSSPRFRVQMPHDIQRTSTSRYMENIRRFSDSGQELQVLSLSAEGKLSLPNANESSVLETYHETQCLMKSDIDFSSSLQVKEGEYDSGVDKETIGTPFTFNDHQSRSSYLQNLTKKAAYGSIDSLVKGLETADPTSTHGDAVCLGSKVSVSNADNLNAERNIPKRISHVTGDGLPSYLSAKCAHDDRDLVGLDETMPLFEGFIIDGQMENEGQDNAGDMINLNTLDLPSTTSEHARILEEICRSASIQTPLSHFSSKYNMHGIHDLYQSVPNGLLERDLKNNLPLDMDTHKLRSSYSYVEEVKTSLYGVPYSNSLSYSGTPFSWNPRNHNGSPVTKLWERFSSSSSSSGKRLSSNPELACFPIEEEENDNAEEADGIQQDTVSGIYNNDSGKRQPLVEITETCLDPVQSISEAEKHPNRDSLESINTEICFHGTQNRIKPKLRNLRSSKRSTKEGKESQISLGAQSTKRGIKSLHSRFSKPKLSGKTSLRKGVERLSQKEPTHNNIVTGLTSFIPLVQQKQAAAICPAKRDIKVKALEAAGAAKRLEEKRENERKMKKEALKLERARIEKENVREMELNKKKKAEEQKKKDADIAARKKLREEEEKKEKEKEKKRKRVAESRHEQKLADEKLCAGKVEKDKRVKKDVKVNNGKESENPLQKKNNSVNEGGDGNYSKKANTDPQSSYVLEDPDAPSSCNNEGKQMSILEKTAERNDSAIVRSQEKTYDISPYQCSDEEEEEDEIPTTKCTPSWASVDFDLPLQNKLDPDLIFPRESFCSINEVVLPRRLQGK